MLIAYSYDKPSLILFHSKKNNQFTNINLASLLLKPVPQPQNTIHQPNRILLSQVQTLLILNSPFQFQIFWSAQYKSLCTSNLISQKMATVTLGYWNFRGPAQNIRLLLSYTKTPFNEVVYDYGNKPKWFQQDKKDLGFDFPNLPYLIDGDFKLTESTAIVRYIIKRSGHSDLLGKNLQDEAVVDSIIGVFNDIFKELRPLVISDNWQESKNALFDKVKPKLDYLNKFIGDKDFALGYLTYADFALAEFSHFFQFIFPEHREAYPFWLKIRNNLEQLPGIRAYYQRPNAVIEPFGPAAFLKVNPKYEIK